MCARSVHSKRYEHQTLQLLDATTSLHSAPPERTNRHLYTDASPLDLVPFGLNAFVHEWPTVDVYGIQDTVDYLRTGLLGAVAPDFLSASSEDGGVLDLNVIDFYKEQEILGYSITAFPVPHAVPAAGFVLKIFQNDQ